MNSDWEAVRLGDVAAINPEKTSAFTADRKIRYIDISSVSAESGIASDSLMELAYGEAPGRARRVVRPGDVLVSTVRPNLRAFAQVPAELDGQVASTGFAVLRAVHGRALPDYIWALIRTEQFVFSMVEQATGSNYPAIRPQNVSDYTVLLPPLVEQRRIVDLIGALDEAIDAADASFVLAQAASREYRRGMLALAYSGSTTLLGSAAKSRLGKMLSATTATDAPSAPYLRNANVQWNSIGLEDLKEMPFSEADRLEFELFSGDVLICEGGEIGRSAVLDRDLPGVFFQKALHRVRCGSSLLPGYLQMCMEQMAEDGTLDLFSGGSTIPHLTGEKLRKLPIPVTPIEQQAHVVDTMSSMTETTSSFAEYAESLRTLRAELLTSLLSGAHTIPESYDGFLEAVDA